jgi:Ala-tRNA(Pro) deacylase
MVSPVKICLKGKMQDIYQVLNKLNIKYEKYEHPAVFTVEDAQKYDINFDCTKTKNLFLRNKKGDKHYLIVLEGQKRANLKNLETLLGENNLSFASSEKLLKYLGLTPGSVSPFGLINDVNKEVEVVIDKELITSPKVGFHPNINTATLVVSSLDFKKFLDWTGNKVRYEAFL